MYCSCVSYWRNIICIIYFYQIQKVYVKKKIVVSNLHIIVLARTHRIIVIIIIIRYYHYATGWTLKLIIASSVIARTATRVRCILGTVVFTKATSDESKGRSRGLIYVGHTGGCISKVESCTDATTAASIFPPSLLCIHTHTYNIYIHTTYIYI